MVEDTKHTNLLLVDDDHDLVEDLALFLQSQNHKVTLCYDVPSARLALEKAPFDICVVDIVMPGPSGQVFCREIADASDAGIIMMSSLAASETVISLLELGADDYIVKPFKFPELLARIRAVARRRSSSHRIEKITRIGPWTLELAERRLRHDDQFSVALTPSEVEVLQLLTASPGTVFSRADLLAASRTRHHSGADDRAVDNLIKRLRRKIEEDAANPRHIQTVWGKGYCLQL
ncbi:MAG: response regulator transcription factor [Thalassovita sp.]